LKANVFVSPSVQQLFDHVRRLPIDWPTCRRNGRDGLVVGEAGAVGTIGLLDLFARASRWQCLRVMRFG
jgi:hypothetical protein